jgi:hypothetical protein
MNERALRFGASAPLVGILTEPLPAQRVPGAPAVVFLNSGIIHRVGASRLYVQAARRLAADGIASLRFDFSGIGDSESRRDALPFVESAVVETREAMDYLERVTGAETFVLAGLCSGADMAFSVAQVDARVVGMAQLDPYAYRTPRWYLLHYGPKVLDLSNWIHSAKVRLQALGRRVRPDPAASEASSVFVAPEYRRVFPPRAEVEAGLGRLAERGVRFLVCFTGDEPHFLYREQYAESFSRVPFGSRLEVEYLPNSDHTFTHPVHQRWVADRIAGWMAAWTGEEEGGAGRALAASGAAGAE